MPSKTFPKNRGGYLMTLKPKVPSFEVEPMKYGQYLMKHPKTAPKEGMDPNEEGYLVTKTEYTDIDGFPFTEGDWIQKSYIEKNFQEV